MVWVAVVRDVPIHGGWRRPESGSRGVRHDRDQRCRVIPDGRPIADREHDPGQHRHFRAHPSSGGGSKRANVEMFKAMRPSTAWGAGLEADRRGQLKRPFWKRAGIWWLNLLLGLLFVSAGLLEVLSGATLGVWLGQLSLGVLSLATVPIAY